MIGYDPSYNIRDSNDEGGDLYCYDSRQIATMTAN